MGEMLSMEQTTYAKIELGKSSLRYEMAIQIASIIEKKIYEFTKLPHTNNNLQESNLADSNVNGDVNDHGSVPDKIVNLFEELLVLFKHHFKNEK